MKKFIICTLWCLCVVFMACGTASRTGFLGDLNVRRRYPLWRWLRPSTTVCSSWGPTNCLSPGIHQGIAWPFTAQNTGTVAQVNLLLTAIAAPVRQRVTVGIYTNECGGLGAPDELLGRKEVTSGNWDPLPQRRMSISLIEMFSLPLEHVTGW